MSEGLNLLSLPHVVTTYLCNFLDTSCLMNMRLASRGLKSIAEQPLALKRFPIVISSSKQLQRVLESTVSFNNFMLNFKSIDEQTFLTEFADLFGESIRIITIESRGGHERVLYLLRKCKKLEVLTLRSLDAAVLQRCSVTFEAVVSNFRGLRKLSIDEFTGTAATGYDEISMFLKILHKCENLVEFKIPAINAYNQKLISRHSAGLNVLNQVQNDGEEEEDWEQENQDGNDPLPEWEDHRDMLIHPIIDYIKLKASKKLKQVKVINIKNMSIFEWKTLKDLLDICQQHNVRLSGIRASQFISVQNEITHPSSERYNVFQSAYLTCANPGFPFSMLDSLIALRVDVSPVCNLSGLVEGIILALPQLNQMHVKFIFGVEDSQNQLLIKKLFKECVRPSVEKLKLEWFLHEYCPTVNCRDLLQNFINLREIYISAWDALDGDFCLMWANLVKLEKITIKDCKNLTNKAFLGCYNIKDTRNIDLRPLNRLKRLKTLIIRDISGNVNETSILGSFRWIRLRRFEFESTVLPVIREDVYRALVTTPFGQSVEYFVMPRPCSNLTFFNERLLVKGFANLKRYVFT